MILLFLGSPRSTVIVATSIPLSVLTSIVVLKAFNQSLNVMTLGGMALAVGILVDDATVEIENIHRNLAQHKPMRQAILDGAQQIATAAFVSTLSICIVFVPVFLLGGVVGSLFSPLAMAVVAAMLASYLLSRTLIPTLVLYLLPGELERDAAHAADSALHEFTARAHARVALAFDRLGQAYERALAQALVERRAVALGFGGFALASLVLVPFVGRDFFPTVDAGSLRLHVRGPTGTRLEETERYVQRVEDRIRQIIPPDELGVVLDNLGVPNGINLALTDTATVSAAEGEILVSLKRGHAPTASYLKRLRATLPAEFPELSFFAQPADMVGQILNFGLPAPIDVQISGPNSEQAHNYQFAQEIAERVRKIPGAVDVHVHQVIDGPRLAFDVDRSLAVQSGLSERDVAQSLLISLTGTGSTSTNFWLNPKNGVSYPVVIQSPQHRMASIGALQATPVTSGTDTAPQILSGVATMSRTTTPVALNHYNVQPVYDVFANVQGSDLGSVADAVSRVIDDFRAKIPKASIITMRGQVQSMNEAFGGLGFGILFAIVLVYFLMVVNFQSWIDPAIILMALPGVIAGILWLLFATGTTLSVPSLMGAIMAIGVATSNSILLITFANQERQRGLDARAAALSAGRTRLRPVLMTALAMVIGMLPMSLGLGEGGEQNAPLGRAVIGGLTLATLYTLFFVPIAYSLLRRRPPRPVEGT
jgi:multidrug efflux pump subunit AcrB